jgi:DNA-directed RNA polymerase subunit RPC12/RpoP
MAVIPVVSCPKCEKKFKPKAEVAGKKIKCPFCAHPFTAPAAKEKEGKNGNAKSAKETKDAKNPKTPREGAGKASDAKAKPEPAAAVAPAPAEEKKPERDEFESDPDPYGVKNQDLTIRCPHCAKEMASANATICLHCGYNTLTRERGKTDKVFGLTFDRHMKYLLPAIGAATFVFFSVVFLLYYALVSPYHVDDTMFSFTDHESLRMWCTVIFLSWIYGAGTFCFKRFLEQPKPEEVKKET